MENYFEKVKDLFTSEQNTVLANYVKKYEPVSVIITTTLNNIIEGHVVDLHFVPEVVLCVTNILKNADLMKEYKNPQDMLLLIKFNVHYLIYTNIIPMPNIDVYLLESVVDSCLDLLSANIGCVEKKAGTLETLETETCSVFSCTLCDSWFTPSSSSLFLE